MRKIAIYCRVSTDEQAKNKEVPLPLKFND
jgi:DNA invertase Pin-like site-specific DNA recombinase